MTDRRDFLKGSLATAVVLGLTTARQIYAAGKSFPGIIYTSAEPGRWAGKEGAHAPQIEIKGNQVTITTNHPMTEEHHIVKHSLVLADGTVVGGKTFTLKDSLPVSSYELPASYTGIFYATSFCNLHDLWLSEGTR